VTESLPYIDIELEMIHLTGQEREQDNIIQATKQFAFYHPFRFFGAEIKDAYAVADIVISRGGFGTMTELAALKKTVLFIPKPGHQEKNVSFVKEHGAAIVLDEEKSNGEEFAATIKGLLTQTKKNPQMGEILHTLFPVADEFTVLDTLHTVLDH
jgi:UDP-N-acetylglucosamine:LPS N-acetylglucosamine transferase